MAARSLILRSILVSAFALSAQQVFAQKAAPVSELVKAVDIPFSEFKLDNGLHVIVHEDHKAPIVAVSVWYSVGSRNEPKGKTGYAHLFEHIMFNGSEHAPNDYFEYTKEIGATDLNGTTWNDRTNYFETVPKPALEAALFLESDRMGYLLGGLTQEKLDNQIGVVSNEKRQGDNQPYGLVEYKQIETMVPATHPYGHSTIGSLADLKAASLDDIKGWFTDHYGPNNAIVVLAGDITAAEAKPLMQKWFGDIPMGPKVVEPQAPIPTLGAPADVVMKDKVPVTRLYRDWIIPGLNDPDFTPLSVGMAVLGGLASSRLDNVLVREEQKAVAVTAGVLPFVMASFLEVTVDVKPGEDVAAVSARLDALLNDFIAKGPTKDEVERVAMRNVANTLNGLEQVGGFEGKAAALAQGALYSNDTGHYKKTLGELAAMTPEKVTAAMQKWLTRPVAKFTVEPGERETYDETASSDGVRTGVINSPAYFMAPGSDASGNVTSNRQPLSAVDRSTFPAVGTVANLDFPTVENSSLSNGIKVHFAQRTGVPLVRVAVSFDGGYASDPKDALGTTSMMTTMLEEGTTSISAIALAEAQERLGANINAGSSLDRTTVNLSAVKPNLAASLDLLADVIKNPAFDANELERVRVQQLTKIQNENSQPQGIALRNLPPLIYGAGHPYGVPFTGTGDPAVVEKLTRDNLVAYHAQWMRPERAEIFVVGDTSLKEITPLLEARFGKWPSNRMALVQKNFDVTLPPKGGRIIVINRPNSPQSLILAGEVLAAKGTDDLLNLQAANEIMGGDFLSRMNTDLRETKGWSYGVASLIQRPQNDVPFIIFAPVQTNQTGPSVQALIDQMNGFVGDKGVTPAELDRTVKGNTLELAGNYEQSSAVLTQMQNDVLFGRSPDYAETLAAKYQAMDAATLDNAMKEALDIKGLTWLIVGDAAVIESQLANIGLPVEYRGYEPGSAPPTAPVK